MFLLTTLALLLVALLCVGLIWLPHLRVLRREEDAASVPPASDPQTSVGEGDREGCAPAARP